MNPDRLCTKCGKESYEKTCPYCGNNEFLVEVFSWNLETGEVHDWRTTKGEERSS